ncbi:MAG TPA: carboxylating nicotinate-nucleotide diphosphorylase [Rubricoccaceae bacterium]|nr:carboxylating nicotinate-nucleotide diphosphorylase [Rubricoccaceae bacterium]
MLPLPDAVAAAFDDLLPRALAEDVGAGDVTTLATVPAGRRAAARFLAKEDGVLAGLAVAERVFAAVDDGLAVTWDAADGAAVTSGTVFGRVEGAARAILTAERLALNLMQRMSGIATAARRMAEAARPAVVLDTRKTAPGLRALDKWAVALGGARNHRTGLFDMVLVKDNHVDAAGGVEAALRGVHAYLDAHRLDLPVEVEARTLEEVDEVLRLADQGLRVDRLLLDNMARPAPGGLDTTLLAEAVRRVGGRMETEASGNVTLETVGALATTGVDFISSGALTHSVRALDVSLKITLA